MDSCRLMFTHRRRCRCRRRRNDFSPAYGIHATPKMYKCILTNTYDGSIKMIHYLINTKDSGCKWILWHWQCAVLALIYTHFYHRNHITDIRQFFFS